MERIDWINVKSLESEIAHFITKLTRTNPEVTDEELFHEAASILSFELQQLLACTNINQTEGLLEFLERQDWLQKKRTNGFKQEDQRIVRGPERDNHQNKTERETDYIIKIEIEIRGTDLTIINITDKMKTENTPGETPTRIKLIHV